MSDSKTELFSVRLPKKVMREIDDLAEKLCVEGKTKTDFKRHLIISGLFNAQNKYGVKPNLSEDEYQRTQNPQTHADVLDSILLRLEKIEAGVVTTKNIVDNSRNILCADINNKNNKWYKKSVTI